MATVYREPNQVKWIGVRPGHNGEQVIESDETTNVLSAIYTVPADKILLLFGYGLDVWSTVASAGSFYIYDATPAIWRILGRITVGANSGRSVPKSLYPPIELAEDYSLRIITNNAACIINAYIHGVLIDA